jgi:hypothetical protein
MSNGTDALVPLLWNFSVASLRRSVERNWRNHVGGDPPHIAVIKAGSAVGVCATTSRPKVNQHEDR